MLCWGYLGIHPKPMGLLNVAGYYDLLIEFIDRVAWSERVCCQLTRCSRARPTVCPTTAAGSCCRPRLLPPLRSRWGVATLARGPPVDATRETHARQGRPATSCPRATYLYEPKWDGFRCIVFRDGDEIELGSATSGRSPATSPSSSSRCRRSSPSGACVDGEIVVHGDERPRLRRAPAAHAPGRVAGAEARRRDAGVVRRLRPARARRRRPQDAAARRAARAAGEGAGRAKPPDPPHARRPPTATVAADWFERFEGAGLDGVIAKPLDGSPTPDKRVQLKVKHQRTADCVVAGFRSHKDGEGVGSLLLGLFDRRGRTCTTSAWPASLQRGRAGAARRARAVRGGRARGSPVGRVGRAEASHEAEARHAGRRPAGGTRSKDLVDAAAHRARGRGRLRGLMNGRLRHAARFERWRPDKTPEQLPRTPSSTRPPPREWSCARRSPTDHRRTRPSPLPGDGPGFELMRRPALGVARAGPGAPSRSAHAANSSVGPAQRQSSTVADRRVGAQGGERGTAARARCSASVAASLAAPRTSHVPVGRRRAGSPRGARSAASTAAADFAPQPGSPGKPSALSPTSAR